MIYSAISTIILNFSLGTGGGGIENLVSCMSGKLGGLWKEFDIVKKEKLQNFVFPEGVFYDQEIEGYRTPRHNSFILSINI